MPPTDRVAGRKQEEICYYKKKFVTAFFKALQGEV
jgi:hypothetical protein